MTLTAALREFALTLIAQPVAQFDYSCEQIRQLSAEAVELMAERDLSPSAAVERIVATSWVEYQHSGNHERLLAAVHGRLSDAAARRVPRH
jgi:hypothetical protein